MIASTPPARDEVRPLFRFHNKKIKMLESERRCYKRSQFVTLLLVHRIVSHLAKDFWLASLVTLGLATSQVMTKSGPVQDVLNEYYMTGQTSDVR